MTGKKFQALRALIGVFVLAGLPGGSAAAEVAKPNIVFILIDDLGWADLACYGNKFHETPHVDALARQGMRFTDFYAASPVCSSTRASIHAGQYTPRVGVTNFIRGHWRPFEKLIEPPNGPSMPLGIVTIAEALKQAGYTTGHFGKWHLGPATHSPEKQGYDVSVVRGDAESLTDATVKFIRENRGRPFFVDLSHYWVHIPLRSGAEQIEKYRRKPKPPQGINNPVYAAMVADVDESTGRIMALLDELKLAENTVLIFTSDNGGLRRIYHGRGELVTSNAPLRDEKGSLYEGGIREPLVVRWPGVVRPGSVCREPTVSVDFYPTLLEVAAARPPADQVLDGVSLVPLLKQSGGLKREAIYFHYPHYHHSRPAGAIRAGALKLIEFFDDDALELYNLEEDIGEKTNLAEKLPQKARSLRAKLRAWRESVGAKMPRKNPEYDPGRAAQWWSRRSKRPL
jgi:uncharacterized sulfatase